MLLAPAAWVQTAMVATTLLALLLSGAVAARIGGANPWRGALRVVFWGALAMAVAALVGRLFDV
jgi:VIT family.